MTNNKATNTIFVLMAAVMVFLGVELHSMRNDANQLVKTPINQSDKENAK